MRFDDMYRKMNLTGVISNPLLGGDGGMSEGHAVFFFKS